MRHPGHYLIFAVLSLLLGFSQLSQELAADGEARLLRMPTVHGEQLAFAYAGDIWLASSQGGPA